ncbi:MAG: hypothetical protein Q8M06_03335 [Methanobacteriaceae archaeon]|nr:hypothetical protein [Methanobacteriaceae archaeon]
MGCVYFTWIGDTETPVTAFPSVSNNCKEAIALILVSTPEMSTLITKGANLATLLRPPMTTTTSGSTTPGTAKKLVFGCPTKDKLTGNWMEIMRSKDTVIRAGVELPMDIPAGASTLMAT